MTDQLVIYCKCGRMAYRKDGQPNERFCPGCTLSIHACECWF